MKMCDCTAPGTMTDRGPLPEPLVGVAREVGFETCQLTVDGDGIVRAGGGRFVAEYRFRFDPFDSDGKCMAAIAEYAGAERRQPRPRQVIRSGPATVVIFEDGTKAVTRCADGDEYDMQLGVLLCALRRSGRNRLRLDDWEPVLSEVSGALFGPDDMRDLARALELAADIMDCDTEAGA